MKTIRILSIALVALGAILGLYAWIFSVKEASSLTRVELKGPKDQSALGVIEFQHASFGGLSTTALETNALPWRLAATALVMQEVSNDSSLEISKETLGAVLKKFGFLIGSQPQNAPLRNPPNAKEMPLGINSAFIAPIGGSKLLVANLGCAACHAGATYDAAGQPRPAKSWLGMPNTSINLEAYVLAIFAAMRTYANSPDAVISASKKLFPDMDWRETATLRYLVLPRIKRRLEEMGKVSRPLPFPNGVPGATNGVAALKFKFGLPLIGGGLGDNGIVSIPDLGSRVWRTNLLVDGAYAPEWKVRQKAIRRSDINGKHLKELAAITSFFTVPSMGVSPNQALVHRSQSEAIFAFLSEKYEPQPFPAQINIESAFRGFDLFKAECAQCHGEYEWSDEKPELIMFPNWSGNVGTDPLRAKAFSDQLAGAISQTPYMDIVHAKHMGEYSAPPLTGIWASAPYLHNGSVPSIANLLTPQLRQARFLVGGHELDFDTLGIRMEQDGKYRQNYKPFSTPVWYDTSLPGQTNGGHLYGESLDYEAKRDLIEFLKLI